MAEAVIFGEGANRKPQVIGNAVLDGCRGIDIERAVERSKSRNGDALDLPFALRAYVRPLGESVCSVSNSDSVTACSGLAS